MLDYEILSYKLEYITQDGYSYQSVFHTEESAIAFIKEHRESWKKYRLIMMQTAIIDF